MPAKKRAAQNTKKRAQTVALPSFSIIWRMNFKHLKTKYCADISKNREQMTCPHFFILTGSARITENRYLKIEFNGFSRFLVFCEFGDFQNLKQTTPPTATTRALGLHPARIPRRIRRKGRSLKKAPFTSATPFGGDLSTDFSCFCSTLRSIHGRCGRFA